MLFIHVLFSGMYSNGPGRTSLIVKVSDVVVEPPLLFAQIVYDVAVVSSSVAMPHIVPLLKPKVNPAGSGALIAHDVIVPEPFSVALRGKLLLLLPLVNTSETAE